MSVVPTQDFKTSVSTNSQNKPSSSVVSALPDTFRCQDGGATPLSTQTNGKHPLESKLKNWDQTQRNRDLEQYRRVFGIAEPMKREMELAIVQNTDFNPLSERAGSGLHQDILLNREACVDWEDVYPGSGIIGGVSMGMDVHGSIEKSLGI
ncbi:LADA_0D03598g1_1 [Lachancea dasiensis]|uniref:LADA_0D03598g1_1 n=1 Tax=Lachancea dasiensis TaxID=1072105 RepID=A0A1G4J4P4_9SACH|nr:LADA_0D03598g1_1 [Lachancea dasiensis]